MRRLVRVITILLWLGVPAWYVLVLHSPKGESSFPLDIGKLRSEANALLGPRPAEVRVEHVMSMNFFESMLMAGDPWLKTAMPVYSYQVVYPDKTLIIDAALSRSQVMADFVVAMFDDAAYQRMNAGMAQASQIVVTHEHADHIGGVVAHPNLAALLPALRLNGEQLGNPGGMKPAEWPGEVMKDYKPLQYEGLLPIAPGVVLVKSPGHTPGSQMVFVQLADGRELLFLGDVSWRLRNIEHVRERPLFMTLLIGEDRQSVLAQFQALHDLVAAEPAIRLVPGHDGPAVERLVEGGFLMPGFKLQ